MSVQNNDGRQISYKYQDDCGVKRVSEVFEHTGPQNGQRMKISYRNGNTTVFETQGLDGEISRTGDNRKFTYHFDNFGCPADVFRQRPVRLAGLDISRRMVMHYGYLRGSLQQCFPKNGTYIRIRSVYSAGADTYLIDQSRRLIQ